MFMAALIAWVVVQERRAESSAREFCESIDPGSAFGTAIERARTAGEDRLRILREDTIVVGFTGLPPFSRHLCEVTRDGDEVGGKRTIYLD